MERLGWRDDGVGDGVSARFSGVILISNGEADAGSRAAAVGLATAP